jgi:integrase
LATSRKRGKTWRFEVKLLGVRESQTFDTKAAGQFWATQREGEILAGKRGQIIPRTVKQAFEQYARVVSPKHRGERWEKVRLTKLTRECPFSGRLMGEVQKADVTDWRDAMLEKLAASSARREYGLVRAVFAMARDEWGWLHKSPFDTVSPPPEGRARTRRVSDDELDRIMLALNYERGLRPETASQFIAAACLFSLETAMRQGEILSLTRDEINAPARFARLSRTKNGDERDVPLSKAALTLIELLPNDFLFPVAAASFDTLFRRARNRAGLADIHFHDIRREATTRLAKKLDVLTLAKMTGHRDVKIMLRTYYQPDMADVAARLD